MEEKDLKQIWQSNIDRKLEWYLDSKLEEMVVRNARRAIGGFYGGITGNVIRLVLIGLTLWGYVMWAPPHLRWLTPVLAIISLGAYGAYLWSFVKMRQHNPATPLKEWVESRIKEVDRYIRVAKKYSFLVGFSVGLIVLAAMLLPEYLVREVPLSEVLPSFAFGVILVSVLVALSSRNSIKNSIRARERLQNLLEQLEE